ncbi:hypothetical protein AUJ67_04045 [Candidatus Desantisbacteria bacterium CG1_02_49_89]|nr:MAG: hypothetical protein AUJ67_04045 [Candidatus Desantisbacteria bacterium CG1_02_49_89]
MSNLIANMHFGKKITAALIALVAIVCIYVIPALAVTTVVNKCTSTFQMTGAAVTTSGWDTANVRVQTSPSLTVKKYAKNIRTGIEQDYSVDAVTGDSIEFRITWSNDGEAKADTIVLRDYIPSGMTYIAASATDTEINCDSPTTATYNAGLVSYTGIGAAGTDPSPAANGVIRFRVTVN